MRANYDHFQTLIQASLDGLAAGPVGADQTPELVFEMLVSIGDATRADVRLPTALVNWLQARTLDEMNAALGAVANDLDGWAVPSTIDDESLPFLLVRRDSITSVEIAATRWGLGHDFAPSELAGLQRITSAVRALDARLATLLTRSKAEALMGERVRLLGSSPWTRSLPTDADAHVRSETIEWVPEMETVTPSDDVVTGYVLHGHLARFVEGAAAKSSEFSEELQGVIQAAKEDGEFLSFRARSWFKNRSASRAPLRVSSMRPQLAAATDELEMTSETVELGVLVGSSHARLVVTAAEVALTVYAPHGQLTSVELGGVAATASEGATSAKWIVVTRRPEAPVKLRVVASDGDVYEELVEFTAEKP